MFEKYIVKRREHDDTVARLERRISEAKKETKRFEEQAVEARAELASAKDGMQALSNQVTQLNKKANVKVYERDLKEYMDPVPEGETDRAGYMSQVAGMFEGGLRDKLNHMHSQFKNQTGMFPLTERETDFFRSCINVVGLLLDWGEDCVNEHHSNIANANELGEQNAFDDQRGKEAVENIKSKIK